MTYLRRTILMPILHLLPDTPLTMQLDWDNGQCQRIARQVEAIKRAGARAIGRSMSSPTSWCRTGRSSSHRTGAASSQKESEARGEPQGYAEQVAYADTIIEDLVTRCSPRAGRAPVVLIQADEGPIPARDLRRALAGRHRRGAADQVRHPERLPLPRRRLQPAAAGHLAGQQLPGDARQRCSASTCRSFPTGCSPSRTTCSIYEFHDVTDRVRCAAPAASRRAAGRLPALLRPRARI